MPDDDPLLLFVEDNHSFRRLITNQLREEGYRVIVADDREEAVRVLDDNQVDVILLDVMLQEDSGYVLLEQIHDHKKNPPPVLMISAIKEAKFKESMEENLEYDGYLEKPCSGDEIKEEIKHLLSRNGTAGPGK